MIEMITALILAIYSMCPQCKHDAEPAAFVAAADEFRVDAVKLVKRAYFESSLNSKAVGKAGEIGLCQVHGAHRQACEAASIDPLSVRCCAFLMVMDTNFCGSAEAGAHRFMSGSCNGTPASHRKIKGREAEWKRMETKWKKQ